MFMTRSYKIWNTCQINPYCAYEVWKANLYHLAINVVHITVQWFSSELRIAINAAIVGKYLQVWGK